MNIRKKVLPMLLAAILTGGLASAANPVIPDPLPSPRRATSPAAPIISTGAAPWTDRPSLSPICTA